MKKAQARNTLVFFYYVIPKRKITATGGAQSLTPGTTTTAGKQFGLQRQATTPKQDFLSPGRVGSWKPQNASVRERYER